MPFRLHSIPLLAALAACGSTASLPSPDGSRRTPVNDARSIERYHAAQAAATDTGRDATQRRIAALEAELAGIRLQRDHVTGPSCGTAGPPPAGAGDSARDAVVEVRTNSLLLRWFQPFGEVRFAPTASMQRTLIAAARRSDRVEIRGRTDANRPDTANRKLAGLRAEIARRFLLGQGIVADKLHLDTRASGDFIADNHTAIGRNHNRRIEIELRLPDSEAQHIVDAATRETP